MDRIRHPEVGSLDLATIMRALGDPLRIEVVRLVDSEGEILCTELYERLGLPNSTGSYHLRQLREAGITRAQANGSKRMISLRREDLESRFPGLLDLRAQQLALDRPVMAAPYPPGRVFRSMRLPRSGNLRAIGVCAAIAVGASLGILAPPAMAAPANDNFASRADLGDALPVHVEESNVGATQETGERVGELARGHSIWWKWEAPATQWTTVDTCGSSFLTVLGIFEGSELAHLQRLVQGNASEGPQCWARGTTDTFFAEAGKSYDIGVDGNGFSLPEAPRPSGEGLVKLSIEATPPPPDDDLADATSVDGIFMPTRESPFEEPNDDRHYWGEVDGYNWGAVAEAGEPEHAGVPGGASVWYSWTPSESGEAWFSIQSSGGPELLALYKGSSIAGLTPVASSAGPFAAFWADVEAGTEYKIAVDGAQAGPSNRPAMGSFALGIELKVPPVPAELTNESIVVPAQVPLAGTVSTANAPLKHSPTGQSKHRKKHHRKVKQKRHRRARLRAARHHAAG